MADKPDSKVIALKDMPPIQGYCGLVWELIDTKNSDAERLNLAVVTVDQGQAAQPHLHRATEEIYFILEGEGEVDVGGGVSEVFQGHAVFIPPGYVHTIRNTGSTILRLLALNSPPYDPSDTFFPPQ